MEIGDWRLTMCYLIKNNVYDIDLNVNINKCKKLFSLKHGVRASLITHIKKQISKLNPQSPS